MNRLPLSLTVSLIILIALLLNSIFFGNNSYQKKSDLIVENDIQIQKNDELKNKNDILEFEIKNAQQSNEHVENFAREKLNLVYPEEEFISFKDKESNKDEK
ncbi:cell division protein FtsL [Gammaproteobacteria bacterium]|nr:cell division protein FtsL [Gammaproteobacteria bacterium]